MQTVKSTPILSLVLNPLLTAIFEPGNPQRGRAAHSLQRSHQPTAIANRDLRPRPHKATGVNQRLEFVRTKQKGSSNRADFNLNR